MSLMDDPQIANFPVQLHHPASGVGADRRDDVDDERRTRRQQRQAAEEEAALRNRLRGRRG